MLKKVQEQSLDGFKEHEVLEIILYYAVPRRNTNEMAHKLIDQFGSIRRLFEATPEEIMRRTKYSFNTAMLINLFSQVHRIYWRNLFYNDTNEVMNDLDSARVYLTALFEGKATECFYVICLDSGYRVIKSEMICEGTVSAVHVQPRQIVESAIRNNAVYVILGHNHPGKTARPSREDIKSTAEIKITLERLDLKLLDHIIVYGCEVFSFRESNIMF